MSAPDTNTDKQAKQHRGPLRGMAGVVIFALILLAALAFFVTSRGGSPEGSEGQVDGRTGDATGADGASEQATGQGEDGVNANDAAADDGTGSAETNAAEPDPAAVTVPAETVTAPDTGAGVTADTEPGESQAARPLDESPGDGEVEPTAD